MIIDKKGLNWLWKLQTIEKIHLPEDKTAPKRVLFRRITVLRVECILCKVPKTSDVDTSSSL